MPIFGVDLTTGVVDTYKQGAGQSIIFGAVVRRRRECDRVLFATAVVKFSGTAAAAFWLATMRRANIDIIRLCKFNFFFSLATTCTGMIIVQKGFDSQCP